MRVALLWPYYPPEMGAASNRGATLAAFLQREGCKVTVCAPKPSYLVAHDEPPPQVPVARRIHARIRTKWQSRTLRLAMETLAAIAAIPETLKVIRSADAVVVSSPPLLYGLAGVLAARVARKPVLLDIRDVWPDILIESGEYEDGILIEAANRAATLAYRLSSSISVVTHGSVDKIRAHGIPVEKIFVAANGVEAALAYEDGSGPFAHVRELVKRTREKRCRRTQFRLVYAGLLGPAQGVEVLLEALKLVNAPVRIDVVGSGSKFSEIQSAAAGLDVEVRLHGLVSRSKALEIAARSDAAFVPLSSEKMNDTIPSKMFEVMALGLPVLTVASGEASEIISSSRSGLVSTPGRPDELAANIEKMVRDRESLKRMGDAAQELVRKNYIREDLYRSILENLKVLAVQR